MLPDTAPHLHADCLLNPQTFALRSLNAGLSIILTDHSQGYGDFSPTVVASELMLLLVLVITFTVLPYQTGNLLTVLQQQSVYQRARFSQVGAGTHTCMHTLIYA